MMEWGEIRFRKHVIERLVELDRLQTDTYEMEPTKDAFDGLTAEDIKTYQVGKVTIREVELWLGRELPRRKKPPQVSPATIDKAIRLLEAYGYTVTKPDQGPDKL